MHQPTIRVLEILESVVGSGEGKRLTDFSSELQIPKSTLVPILQTLCGYRYLTQDDMGRYQPGTALFSLGSAFSGNFPTLNFVHQQLEQLVEELGETCYFGALEDGYVLYLDKVDSRQPLRMLTSIGRRMPAYATSIGKALLSDMVEKELQSLYPEGLKALTAHTITDVEVLAKQLGLAREEGYAWETEESMEHIRCFAVPIRKHGRIVAAVSVAIPVFRFDKEKKDHTIVTLQKAAAQISGTIEMTDAHFGNLF
ncbi:MAG: IclR family transcriptional regulator [Lachnospiraceae bacterium]|nr:IclR family transcriptional regulator [Lachnospiraceae bacterium]